jgi:transcription elongation GreA/GreB family factor
MLIVISYLNVTINSLIIAPFKAFVAMSNPALSIKAHLHQLCIAYISQRIAGIQQAMAAANQASADDTKSSAGDKYETTREMMQQETNRNAAQLAEAGKINAALNKIKPDAQPLPKAGAGSLIFTTEGNFYMAIGAGSFVVDGITFHAISPASPIGLQLQKRGVNDSFELNRKMYRIINIV